jgi:hypothetical protein
MDGHIAKKANIACVCAKAARQCGRVERSGVELSGTSVQETVHGRIAEEKEIGNAVVTIGIVK